MKKSMLLTFSSNYNYGAILQTYAMIKALESIGVEAVIPNYVPPYVKSNTSFFRNVGLRGESPIKNIYRRLVQLRRYQKFDKFRKDYLPIKKSLSSMDEIKLYVHSLDSVITGSDQTWNLNWFKSFDGYFFQDFFDSSEQTKKVSYASCFGNKSQPNTYLEQASSLLDKFDSIAVRNEMSLDIVAKSTNKEASLVVDPTILYDFKNLVKESWKNQLDLILVYGLDETHLNQGRKIAEKLKALHGSKIVFINGEKSHQINWADELMDNKGPMEWLELFYRARYIVTDSFHGCVFATKFEKQFIPYTKGWRAGRIDAFLGGIGLDDLIVRDDDMPLINDNYWDSVDYKKVLEKLRELRVNSMRYLKNSHNVE